MKQLRYQYTKEISIEKLIPLYQDANWIAYTKTPDLLQQAIAQSLFVVSVWDNDLLVGLVRVVGDGLTIIYIQDILVLKAYKRQKIGTKLVEIVLKEFKSVRQKVLLTDDTPETRGFYETSGFTSCDKGSLVAFAKFS